MKKFLLLSLSALVALSSCSKSPEVETGNSNNKVSFLAKINNAISRASNTSFDEGDAIGVFAKESGAESFYAENVEYRYTAGSFSSETPIVYDAADLEFKAVYPYAEENAAQFEFSVEADQSAQGAYTASDLMFAQTEATHQTTPSLVFDHKLASIEVSIEGADASNAEVSVMAAGSVSVDIEANTYEAMGEASQIVAASTEEGFKAIVAPQTISAGEKFITISIDGEEFSWVLSNDVSLQSGYKYACKASFFDGTVEFEGDITEWNDGGDLPLEYDDPADKFTASLVSVEPKNVVIDVNMGKYEGNYYVGMVAMDDYPGSAMSLAAAFMYNEVYVYHTDLTIVDNMWVFNQSGEVSLANGWGIEPHEDYAVVAFGINDLGNIMTDVAEIFVSTPAIESLGSIAMELDEVGLDYIKVKTTPTEGVGSYVVAPVSKEFYDSEYAGDLKAVTDDIVYSLKYREQELSELVYNGETVVDVSEFWTIRPSKEYIVFAFGIDEDGYVNSDISQLVVTTASPAATEGALASLTVNEVTGSSAFVSVDAGDYSGYYYIGCTTKDIYESAYEGDPEVLAAGFVETEIGYYGTDLSVANNRFIFDGSCNNFDLAEAWPIKPLTEYVVVAFGLLSDGTVDGEVFDASFTTVEMGNSENNITFEVKDITSNGAVIICTPSNGDKYFANTSLKSKYDSFGTEAEFCDYYIDYFGSAIGWYTHTGVFECSYQGYLETGADYYAFAFGYDNDTRTTDLYKVAFSTLSADDGSAAPAKVSASKVIIPDHLQYDIPMSRLREPQKSLQPTGNAVNERVVMRKVKAESIKL